MPNRPLEKRKLMYEDVYPLLYMKYRLPTSKDQKGIKHIVIDEMKDIYEIYKKNQYGAYLKKLMDRRYVDKDQA